MLPGSQNNHQEGVFFFLEDYFGVLLHHFYKEEKVAMSDILCHQWH